MNPTECVWKKVKTEETCMFDCLFIKQRVSTSKFCLITKIFLSELFF